MPKIKLAKQLLAASALNYYFSTVSALKDPEDSQLSSIRPGHLSKCPFPDHAGGKGLTGEVFAQVFGIAAVFPGCESYLAPRNKDSIKDLVFKPSRFLKVF